MRWKFLCLDHGESRPLAETFDGTPSEALARAIALERKPANFGLVFAATDGPVEEFDPPAGWHVQDIGPVPLGWTEIHGAIGPGPVHRTAQSSCEYHLARRGRPLCLRVLGHGGEITQIILTQAERRALYDGRH